MLDLNKPNVNKLVPNDWLHYLSELLVDDEGTLDDLRRTAINTVVFHSLLCEMHSVYKGQTWIGYRPGEDVRFKNAYVTRGLGGEFHSAVNTEAELVENARRCLVRFRWAHPQRNASLAQAAGRRA